MMNISINEDPMSIMAQRAVLRKIVRMHCFGLFSDGYSVEDTDNKD